MRMHWILGGWISITASLALHYSIDLLWGVVVLLVITVVTAAVLPRLQLAGVRVRRLEFPNSAMVGEPQRIGYEIDTPTWLPRYGIEIHERFDSDAWSLATYVARSRGHERWFLEWTPRLRGCWQLAELQLASGYPLGMRRACRTLPSAAHEIIVFPDFVQLRWLPVRGATYQTVERSEVPQRGGEGEFFALKPYRHGDAARRVHWRASARLGEIVTREHEHLEDKQLWIVLELAAAAHVGTGQQGTCEQMIRIAHSAIVKAHAEAIPVGLLYRVADAIQCVPPAADRCTFEQLRDRLARVQTHTQLPLDVWLLRFREQLPNGGTWLVFNLAGEPQRARTLAAVRGQSATPLLVEFDKASFAGAATRSVQPPRTERDISTPTTLRCGEALVSIVTHNADLTKLFAP